jgi:hypothetical protein
MKCQHIPDGDSSFRECVRPVSFRKRVFAKELFFNLSDQLDGFLGSLSWEKYVPTTELVHAHGCSMVFRRNEKKRQEEKFTEKNRQIYCGAYQLKANVIRTLVATDGLEEILSADVVHHLELGEIAHTDLKITLKPGSPNIEGTKTVVLDRLWQGCSGPLKHICGCDKDIAPHPSSDLPMAPIEY